MLANINMELVLEIFFLFFSNSDIKFIESQKLIWRSYDTAKALLTASRIELINKREYTTTAMNKNLETFVIYIATLEILTVMLIHLLNIS